MGELVDITDELFGSLALLTDFKVVQSPLFNLLEGTRAIEIANPRLDTGLIDVTPADLNFDPAAPQLLKTVIAVQNKLLVGYMSWLNNLLLPVTVLCCRYVQTMLQNYLHLTGTLHQRCLLKESRLKEGDYDKQSIEYQVVHRVLLAFIIGISRFIGFTLKVAMEVLYEEEDITTRSMNMNFLVDDPLEVIMSELDSAVAWLNSQDLDRTEIEQATANLEMVKLLLSLEFVLSVRLDVFTPKPLPVPFPLMSLLEDGQRVAKKLNFDNLEVPEGSFSPFIQLDVNNSNIPVNLYLIEPDTARQAYLQLFVDVKAFVVLAAAISNTRQFYHFLRYGNVSNSNVLARGIFQLFVVRDDKLILGLRVYLDEYCASMIDLFVGCGTQIMGPLPTDQLTLDTTALVHAKVEQFRRDLELGMYHNLLIYGNNRCRQQQLRSKGLLVWDTLQVNGENLELDLFTLNIGDELALGEASLLVSSYIFFTKLMGMNDLLLNGVDLQLYKPHETYLVYWYSLYLTRLQVDLINGRLCDVVEGKIHQITEKMPKRLKKLKGEKKQRLKAQIAELTAQNLPELEATLKYHKQYLAPKFAALNELVEAVRIFLIVMYALGLVDFLASTPNALTSFEHLFALRLKPWSLIGVPQLPQFAHYKQSLNVASLQPNPATSVKPLLQLCLDKLASAKQLHKNLVAVIRDDPSLASQFLPSSAQYATQWYENLIKTSIVYSLEVASLQKRLEAGALDTAKFKMIVEPGSHPYFPRIRVGEA